MLTKFNIDVEALSKAETWKEFDEMFTTKMNTSFKTTTDYYLAASCLPKL